MVRICEALTGTFTDNEHYTKWCTFSKQCKFTHIVIRIPLIYVNQIPAVVALDGKGVLLLCTITGITGLPVSSGPVHWLTTKPQEVRLTVRPGCVPGRVRTVSSDVVVARVVDVERVP